MGLVHYCADQLQLAKKWLEIALQVNIEETGETNLRVAKIYEVLAMVYD